MLTKERLKFKPTIPQSLSQLQSLTVEPKRTLPVDLSIQSQFPHLKQELLSFKIGNSASKPLRVGILLSGGPAAGGHNVIAGVWDGLQQLHPGSQLIGFLDGPAGLIDNKFKPLGESEIAPYRNQGGFHLLGTGRTKIETEAQFAKSMATVKSHSLDGLIVVGGDDSNTNAAFLAEYFLAQGLATTVVGVPKTIDGDLKNQWVETSFGFDSAAKTYSEFIGNVLQDALSHRKYYFFIKVMGRTASHLVLECALQTHPNLALISEEIQQERWTLNEVVQQIVDLIVERSKIGKEFGAILIPEGIIEFIPDITFLDSVQKQLMLDHDPHGNVQVSKIDTERLLIDLVTQELKRHPEYKGKFAAQPLFCGYEGRSCFPSHFDCNYCYALGLTSALLVQHKATGYMATVVHLSSPPNQWEPRGVPLIAMMGKDERKGKTVIRKELVDLEAAPFQTFKSKRASWRLEEHYLSPGPIQFFGPAELTDCSTLSLKLI